MILGKLSDIEQYKNINENLDTAIDYILNNNLNELKKGTNTIDGNKVFINRFSYTGADEKECIFEGHKKYIDIHIVLDGMEKLGYNDISNLTAVTEYDEETDFVKYEGKVNTYCNLDNKMFCITFPEDIHMPKIKVNEQMIEKAVCKVLIK